MSTWSWGKLAPVEAESGWRQWRDVRISSRSGEARELTIVRELVDRLHAAGLTYAIGDVYCDSKACMYTVRLKPGAQAPWAYLEAVVRAWVDETWHCAWIEGEQLGPVGSVELQPDEGDQADEVDDAVVLLRQALRLLQGAAGKRGS